MPRDEISELLEAAERLSSDESQLMGVVNELERRVAEEGGARLQYACAYAWYLHPRRLTDDSIRLRVDQLLKAVLESSPRDFLALLYLGHNRYDCRDYVAAARHFEGASAVAPKSYIGLKAHELLACSRIALGGEDATEAALEAFALEASNGLLYAKEDIWPKELAEVLGRVAVAHLPDTALTKVTGLIDRLELAGGLNGWLREALLKK